jgi:hypothetical protein
LAIQPGTAAYGTTSKCAASSGGFGRTTGQGGQLVAAGGGVCSGWIAHPAADTRMTATRLSRTRAMWIIFVEMGVVLLIAALIVWWTWPRKKKPDDVDRSG